MLFMVIEKFRHGDARAVGKRFEKQGPMLPENVQYVASCIDETQMRCFELMPAPNWRGAKTVDRAVRRSSGVRDCGSTDVARILDPRAKRVSDAVPHSTRIGQPARDVHLAEFYLLAAETPCAATNSRACVSCGRFTSAVLQAAKKSTNCLRAASTSPDRSLTKAIP